LTPRNLDFMYFDAGGGHRSAATALKAVVESQDRGWNVRLVNLQEVLDPLDVFRKITGMRMQDIYNLMLSKGMTLGSEYLLPVMHRIIRHYHPGAVKLLKEFWAGRSVDLLVSLVPNMNRALYESLHAVRPDVPMVTILTDFADYPPHFWIERQPQYFVCGTAKAVEQALSLGHPTERVFSTSGMIVRPEFYEDVPISRAVEREKLGLDPDLPTALVLFGGEGSGAMWPIAKHLGNSKSDLQLILICGRNASLKQRLERLQTRNRKFVEGFTSQIPYYMRISDFFVGKPGPGSISEAVRLGLPVIVSRNLWTLPQERYNADWVEEHGVGVVLKDLREIEPTVQQILSSGKLAAMQRATRCIGNRAVFEIPDILERVMAENLASERRSGAVIGQ
jgi:hypothetical protein